MPKAPRICLHSGCTTLVTNTRYCTEHQPPPWQGRTTGQGSTRATREARRTCLERAHYRCQIAYNGCTGHATHADHITNIASTNTPRSQATDPDSLQAACGWCHGIKTQAEASKARQR